MCAALRGWLYGEKIEGLWNSTKRVTIELPSRNPRRNPACRRLFQLPHESSQQEICLKQLTSTLAASTTGKIASAWRTCAVPQDGRSPDRVRSSTNIRSCSADVCWSTTKTACLKSQQDKR